MKEYIVKALKGLLLAVIFGGIAYVILQKVFPAVWIGVIMFASMFVKPKEQRQQNSNVSYTKNSKKKKKK